MSERPPKTSPHGRRFSRLRRRSSDGRSVTQSMYLPPRQPMSDDEDDQEDVCAPRKDVPQNLNQSIFQFFTQGRVPGRLSNLDEDDESGEEDGDNVAGKIPKSPMLHRHKSSLTNPGKLGSIEEFGQAVTSEEQDALSDSSRSELGPAPFMSQILEAEAQLQSTELKEDALSEGMVGSSVMEGSITKPKDLAKKLMDIFCLPEMEEVETEYPCWLLQSVLLQGYMYITKRHICFYAYLPKKADRNTKTGYLSKRGKSTLKFTRYWFVLKGDVLSYFSDPSDLYFPNGRIDLRYGISANLVETRDGTEPTAFTIHTDQRHYYFKTERAASAREWVKALQKAIFRSHNDGDSVKISIPVGSIIDVEDSPVLEFADTLKINVLDPETHAIDDYFFSFFSYGQDALGHIRSSMEEYQSQKAQRSLSGASTPVATQGHGVYSQQQPVVRTTLSPRSPRSPGASSRPSPRHSMELTRSSFDVNRRSTDLTRESLKEILEPARRSMDDRERKWTPHKHSRELSRDSLRSDISFGESSGVRVSSGSVSPSGSQILSRSDVFHSPTIKKFARSLSRSSSSQKGAKQPAQNRYDEPPSSHATIRVEPPTRRHTADSNHEEFGSGHAPEGSMDNHSDTSLQEIAKRGKFPLQRASMWAGWIGQRSKKAVGSLIPSQPMGYLEKVSDMWQGGKRHYREPAGMEPHENMDHTDDEGDNLEQVEERYRNHFALPKTEQLTASYFGYLHRVFPVYGKFYLGSRHACFRSLIPGTKTKMILPLDVVENVTREKGFRFGYSGLVIMIRGHEEIFFEFSNQEVRDDCVVQMFQSLDRIRHLAADEAPEKMARRTAEEAKKEHDMLLDARLENPDKHDLVLPSVECSHASETHAIVFDDPEGSILNFKPTEPMNVTCLTIGSRGDVQPFIALCIGLMKDGHKCKIATHPEFKEWVESYGIQFAPVGGDPAELMALCVEYGMFTVEFMRYTSAKMRGWLDNLLLSSWEACQGSDLLIEAPSAMGGIHIAEALQIPYFRAFTMPWTRTRAYPHAFAVPEHKRGGAYNYFTYVVIDNVFWKATAGQINSWRKRVLKLPRTNLDKLQPHKVPFLYNFSPSVVIPPLDFSDHIRITGYWFLDTSEDWRPPADLDHFIKKARKDGLKIVYVGFGSVTVNDPAAMTQAVVDAVKNANVRCILSKGWSDRMANKDASVPEVPIPDDIFQIKSCPHDWLFRQVDAAVHHGGAGTTGASLRAGIPTIIKPFFGDQFFFANRVEDLGVGLSLRKMHVASFTKALKQATTDARMILKAKILGEQIRSENGVDTAVQSIYRDLEYAQSLIKRHQPPGTAGTVDASSHDDTSEESWTVVGDDDDATTAGSMAQSLGDLQRPPVVKP